MKATLQKLGFTKNYFPFKQSEIDSFKAIAKDAGALSTDDRKKIFKHFPHS